MSQFRSFFRSLFKAKRSWTPIDVYQRSGEVILELNANFGRLCLSPDRARELAAVILECANSMKSETSA